MRRQKDLAFLRKRREHRKFVREFTNMHGNGQWPTYRPLKRVRYKDQIRRRSTRHRHSHQQPYCLCQTLRHSVNQNIHRPVLVHVHRIFYENSIALRSLSRFPIQSLDLIVRLIFRYQDLYGNSVVFVVHSLDHSLSTRLIAPYKCTFRASSHFCQL